MKGKSVSNSVKKSSSFLVGGRSPGLDGNFFIMWRGRKSVYIYIYRMEKSAGCFVYAKLVR